MKVSSLAAALRRRKMAAEHVVDPETQKPEVPEVPVVDPETPAEDPEPETPVVDPETPAE